MAGLFDQRRNALATCLTFILITFISFIPTSNAASITGLHKRDSIANGIDLRVLPIGDSITWGAKDPKESGYRHILHDLLAGGGNKVDFVGGTSNGDFADNQHEGHRGERISEIQDHSGVGIYAAANIVLLHAGTNDANQDWDPKNAHIRLKTLIAYIYKHSPDAVVLVCQIIPSSTKDIQDRIEYFNTKVPGVAKEFEDDGKKILVVKMNEALTTADLADKDNLHPSPEGYQKMADAWYKSIVEASDKKMISKAGKEEKPPPDTTGPDNCRATPAWFNTGQIAKGARVATTDGGFKQTWNKKGVVKAGTCKRENIQFMDLDGDGRDDYACIDEDSGEVDIYLNGKDGKWSHFGVAATGSSVKDGKGVLFGDLNGDGFDDYIYVDDDTGDVSAWINRGKNNGGTGSDDKWLWEGIGKIAGGVGATKDTLQMVDVDGDGRDDFCLIDRKSGAVTLWLNGGSTPMPDYHKVGQIATGASAGSNDTVILGDFTGEGRADYMIVDKNGKTKALINRRDIKTLVPRWDPTFTLAEGPDGVKQADVRFADLTGDGKVDYVVVGPKGSVQLWENTGKGGRSQRGDGVFLADMDGDGVKDYFWINDDGQGWLYLNRGKGTDEWRSPGEVAKGHHDRDMIRMGVMTQSGRADYIVLDDDTGRAVWYRNLGEAESWNWGPATQIADGPKDTIEKKYGWKFHSKNVRFADLSGDGLDDYLYVNQNGAVVMWQNTGSDPPNWKPDVLVADGPAVGVIAREVQFADTDGDGVVDYVAVDRITGRTKTWLNKGFRNDGSGSINWNPWLNFADGSTYPGCYITIAEMTGDHRADYVAIDPDNGALYLWRNGCWKIPDDDGKPDGDGDCSYESDAPEDWAKSGAAGALDNFLVDKGYKVNNEANDDQYYWMDNWLKAADNHFRDTVSSNLDCSSVTTNSRCTAPSDTCETFKWDKRWFYGLNMVTNVHDLFEYAHHALSLESFVDFTKIDKMKDDFDTDPPDPDEFSKILSNIAFSLGMASLFTGKATTAGADIFTILATTVFYTNTNVKAPDGNDDDRVNEVINNAKVMIGNIVENTSDQLGKTLKAFYGGSGSDYKDVEIFFDPLTDDKSISDNPEKSLIGKVLNGGDLIQNIEESDIGEVIKQSIDHIGDALLGNILTGLRYYVIQAYDGMHWGYTEDACKQSTGTSARWIDGECFYFVRREKGHDVSQNVPSDVIDKIEDTYKLSLYDMMKNVKDCGNKPPPKDFKFEKTESYPPCFFGLPYVEGGSPAGPYNEDELPDWLPSLKDLWNWSEVDACKAIQDNPDIDKDGRIWDGIYCDTTLDNQHG